MSPPPFPKWKRHRMTSVHRKAVKFCPRCPRASDYSAWNLGKAHVSGSGIAVASTLWGISPRSKKGPPRHWHCHASIWPEAFLLEARWVCCAPPPEAAVAVSEPGWGSLDSPRRHSLSRCWLVSAAHPWVQGRSQIHISVFTVPLKWWSLNYM